MTCIAVTDQVRSDTLSSAIAEFLRSGDDLGDQLTADEQNRLSAAFDALLKWTAPAASFGDAVAALCIAQHEFQMGQEGDGLARSMLEAAMGFLNAANAPSRSLPAKGRWTRRTTLKFAA